MAKPGKHGELNWHKQNQRWYKKLKNDRGSYTYHFFGPKGTGSSDRPVHRKALREYAAFQEERDREARVAAAQRRVAAVEGGVLPVSDLGDSALEQALLLNWKRQGMISTNGYVNPDVVDQNKRDPENDDDWDGPDDTTWRAEDPVAARREQLIRDARERDAWFDRQLARAGTPASRGNTIADHVRAWLDAEETRQRAGALGETALGDKRRGIKGFTDFAGGQALGKAADVGRLLLRYREHLLGTDLKPHTINARLKFVKQFIDWCYENEVLRQLPRQLKSFAKKLPVEKKGDPLPLDQVRAVWAAAGPRMRCFIALGLNCGFKNGDITALTGGMLQGNRLVGLREKTKNLRVPMNYPLWPLTLELIEQERDRTGTRELVFVNKAGKRIGTSVFSNLFKKVALKAGVQATFEQLRDTALRDVEQGLFAAGADLSLLQVFLAHKDSSTAQYYRSDDPARLQVPALDRIVLGLEQVYALN